MTEGHARSDDTHWLPQGPGTPGVAAPSDEARLLDEQEPETADRTRPGGVAGPGDDPRPVDEDGERVGDAERLPGPEPERRNEPVEQPRGPAIVDPQLPDDDDLHGSGGHGRVDPLTEPDAGPAPG